MRGQQEVQRAIKAAGLTIRRLTHTGDALVDAARGERLHVETKRQERIRMPDWLAQAEAEAPRGSVPVVAFRQSHGVWYACLPLDDLLRIAS